MGEELDYTTLKWVKSEIQESLNQTRQALETFVEDTGDITQVRFCATYLHQVYGTLQMVEIYGAALLAEEMEKVANALANDEVAQKEDALEVLMRAILQLPSYLERLEQGQPDMPVVLLPLLNDLRAARGENLLSENAFFAPNLSVAPPEKQLPPGKSYPDIQAYARKLRPVFQVSLLGWYRDKDAAGSLKKLAAVLRELQNASQTEMAQRLWWVTGGVVEALVEAGLETGVSVKLLMGQVDREIKRLIDHGEDIISSAAPTELLKNCLYYVGSATSAGPRVAALKQAFHLDQLLPYGGDLDQASDDLKGSSSDLLENVSAVIKEDLLHIKDQLDIFVRNTERQLAELTPLSEGLRRVADTLAMLGLGSLRKVVQDQSEKMVAWVEGGSEPDDNALMETASALLYVEAALGNIQDSQGSHADAETAPDLSVHEVDESEVLLPPSEYIHIVNLVIGEAKDVLADVKEGFNTFALEPAQFDVINEAPEKLKQIMGALAVMNMSRPAQLLKSAIAYIDHEVLEKHQAPDAGALDALADVITSVEYYLEAVEEGRGHPDTILAVAEVSIGHLGYPIEGAEALVVETRADEEPVLEEEGPEPGEFLAETPESLAVEAEEPEEAPAVAEADIGFEAEEVALVEEPGIDFDAEITQEIDATGLDFAEAEAPEELVLEAEAEAEPVMAAEPAEAAVEEELAEDIDPEILEIFIEEADEVLGTMTDCLHAWRANNDDRKSLEDLRRSYHTLKGSGRLAGAMVMGEFAWAMENMLNRVMDGKTEATPNLFKLLDLAETTIQGLLYKLKGESDHYPPTKRLSDLAFSFADGNDPAVDAGPAVVEAVAEPEPGAAEENEAVAPEAIELEAAESIDLEMAPAEELGEAVAEPEESLALESAEDFDLSLEQDVSAAPFAEEESFSLDDDLVEAATMDLEDAGEDFATAEALEEPELAFDPVLVEVFKNETATHIATMRDFMAQAQGDYPVSDDLRRALHTLHGSARMAGVDDIAELSEPMDRMVRVLDERHLPLGEDGMQLLADFTEATVARAEAFDAAEPPVFDNSELLARIARLHEQALERQAPPVAEAVDETVAEPEPAAAEAEAFPTEELSAEDLELTGIFLEEADELLHGIDELLQRWHENYEDLGVIAELQRALHTLKGGARLAGLASIGDVTHAAETLLESVVEGRESPTGDLPGLVQSCLDWLASAIEQVHAGGDIASAEDLLARVEGRIAGEPAAVVEPEETVAPAEEAAAEEAVMEEAVDETAQLPEAESLAEEISEPELEDLDLEATEEIEFTFPDETPAAASVPVAQADYDTDLLEIFLEEAAEIQENTEELLHQWGKNFEETSFVAELQRALHTLKGGARMANVTAIGDLAHAMESLLERIAEGQTAAQPQHPGLIQACHDWLSHGLEQAKQLLVLEPASDLINRIEAAIRGEDFSAAPAVAEAAPEEAVASELAAEEPETKEAATQAPAIEEVEVVGDVLDFQPPQEAKPAAAVASEEQVRVRAELLNDLVNYAGEVNIYNSRIAQQLGGWRFNLAELDQTVTRLQEQLRKFEIETEAQIMYRHESAGGTDYGEDFDPLEMDRFSTMQQISRGMVESLGDLTSIKNLLENLSSESDVLLLQQRRVTSDLQEGLSRTRMVAFSNILPRLRRIVRQVCTEIGKQAELHVSGAEGELDRTQLNRIVPALEHILRNAVDHGLETPEEREKAGKPAEGAINITFGHEGSEVVLKITDDGKGLNIDALRKKAVEKGYMQADADLSDQEVMSFILEAGFSTAEKVTQISGRGVGMDVVNNEIKQLGGTLHIDSVPGKGTAFTIQLPLTVLVNQALMVLVGEATYAIQLPNVEHVIRVGRDELEPLVNDEKDKLEYAGNSYHYLNLGKVLTGAAPQLPTGHMRVPLLLVRSGDHRVALQVDTLLGRQEIVIKSVGPQLSNVSVLSGATILPGGEVALILDVASLVRSAMAQTHGAAEPLLPTAEAVAEENLRKTVMVVDDSITVRKVTERLLKRHDYDIITAKDGVDALTVMLEQIPDIMLLDVEMPRMDGYELATTMRNDERLKDVPIIMITSRTGDKHRQRALDIGVNMYMGKPYQEHDLIENIKTLTGSHAH